MLHLKTLVEVDKISLEDVLRLDPRQDIVSQVLRIYQDRTKRLTPGIIQVATQLTEIEPIEAQPKDQKMWARYALLPEITQKFPASVEQLSLSDADRQHYAEIMTLISAHAAAI